MKTQNDYDERRVLEEQLRVEIAISKPLTAGD